MAKNTKYFYVGKGIKDEHPYLYYGENPPIILNNKVNGSISHCTFVGSFQDNPIANSLEDNTVIKIYIRTETIKNKKNE